MEFNSMQTHCIHSISFSFPFSTFSFVADTIRLHNGFLAFYDMCLKLALVLFFFILPVHFISFFILPFVRYILILPAFFLVSFTNLQKIPHFTCNPIQFEQTKNRVALLLIVFSHSPLWGSDTIVGNLGIPFSFNFLSRYCSSFCTLKSLNLIDLLCITFNF